MAGSFDHWLSQHEQLLSQLSPAASQRLERALHSAWLEDAAPDADQVAILVQQAAGTITGDQARERMLGTRAAAFRD
ncbi:hypothetical protein GCM10009551_053700 [Nocardiopsis tropica]|uniref:antitoxin VbhA family protein n=1 Tax=Tsukamurella strandjordii TaxID=147577 RepID=UPI0031E3AC2C